MNVLAPHLAPAHLSRAGDTDGTRVLRFAAYKNPGAYGAWAPVENENEAMLLACTDEPPAKVVAVPHGLDPLQVVDRRVIRPSHDEQLKSYGEGRRPALVVEPCIVVPRDARVLVACKPNGSSTVSYWEARVLGQAALDINNLVHVKVRWLFASKDEFVNINRVWHAPSELSFDNAGFKAPRGHRNPRY